MNNSKRSKKLIFLSSSISVFILLTVLSFNLPLSRGATNLREEAPIDNASPQVGILEGETVPNEMLREDAVPSMEENLPQPSVLNLVADYERNQVVLNWTMPMDQKIQNITLLKTSSKPEGNGGSFDVSKSNGVFYDQEIMPGMRYYYEIKMIEPKGETFSSIVAVNIPGMIEMSFSDHFLRVNGQARPLDQLESVRPYVFNGKAMVPMKPLVEVLGGSVDWIIENSGRSQNAVILRFRNLEIELTAGQFTALVNRNPTTLPIMPVVQNGIFYAPIDIIRDLLGYKVTIENGIIRIEKPVEEQGISMGVVSAREVSIRKGQEFTITLPVYSIDGRRWFYRINGADTLELLNRNHYRDQEGVLRNDFLFQALTPGSTQLIFRYFKQGLGEGASEEVRVYNLEIKESS
jgi:hypothetical protein